MRALCVLISLAAMTVSAILDLLEMDSPVFVSQLNSCCMRNNTWFGFCLSIHYRKEYGFCVICSQQW